jgi:hypothetical protein
MWKSVRRAIAGLAILLVPTIAAAQTSGISGVVKDTSGAVLPGVTVEASSPALIEKTRSATTDGAGQYKITELPPGTYSVTFTLSGFKTIKHDGVELTSDFTAPVNAEMAIGTVEETITVAAQSPIVDVQSITQRTVMTREVMDELPTGNNIQAIGIMVPGTSIAVGGGGALNRDVGGSGGMQQSPLVYKGSGDTIQTIEGMRLNNLCANGAYSGVYWDTGSFQELSYVTGADSAEMGQGGVRVNMVPKDGGNMFHATVPGSFTHGPWQANNYNAAQLSGDRTYNPANTLANISVIKQIWDFNPSAGGPIVKDRLWYNETFRYWGTNKTVAGSFPNLLPNSPFKYIPNTASPGVDNGHIFAYTSRVTLQATKKDKISVYHDIQDKFRPEWGLASNIPPEASGNEVTPTNFVTVEKWTRTQSNKLLFDAGFAMYDQEYTELYQSSVTGDTSNTFNPAAISAARIYTILDNSTNQYAGAWNAPADHFSKLETESGSASYVTGSHSFKFGGTVSEGQWRLLSQYTGNVEPITYNAGVPVSVTLRLPSDRRDSIKADTGLYAQDRWTIKRATLNLGLRYDWFIGETDPSSIPASALSQAITFNNCPNGQNSLTAGCTGVVENWKDIDPRVGISYDVFGNGKTAVKASVARYVNGEQIGTANASNPVTTVGLSDTRAWSDTDGNGSPFDANGNLELNELTKSANSANFGNLVPTTTTTDPATLNGFGKRPYNWEYSASVQHQLFPRIGVNGDWYRRSFGNQTFTEDPRLSPASYDTFCITAPSDPSLPGGGGYPVCGLADLKPSVVAGLGPVANVTTFDSNFGGITNIFEGFDVSATARLKGGTFFNVGINAQKNIMNTCNLNLLGPYSTTTSTGTETFADGSRACDQVFPYRPDVKVSGSHTFPLGIVLSGTYQFSQGPNILANWAISNAIAIAGNNGANGLGRNLASNVTSKTVSIIEPGTQYATNLNQLDVRGSKRLAFGRSHIRIDADLYNVFNTNWPYTLNNTFTTAATSQWLRPTNVLQGRLFKIGGQFDF